MTDTPARVRRWMLSPLNRRRLANFRANRRGYWSFWIMLTLLVLSLFAELIANDRPLLVSFKGHFYAPVIRDYPETTFGGDFDTPADYRDSTIKALIEKDGWIIWPLISFSYDTINFNLMPGADYVRGKAVKPTVAHQEELRRLGVLH